MLKDIETVANIVFLVVSTVILLKELNKGDKK